MKAFKKIKEKLAVANDEPTKRRSGSFSAMDPAQFEKVANTASDDKSVALGNISEKVGQKDAQINHAEQELEQVKQQILGAKEKMEQHQDYKNDAKSPFAELKNRIGARSRSHSIAEDKADSSDLHQDNVGPEDKKEATQSNDDTMFGHFTRVDSESSFGDSANDSDSSADDDYESKSGFKM